MGQRRGQRRRDLWRVPSADFVARMKSQWNIYYVTAMLLLRKSTIITVYNFVKVFG
jgi:hypothetical protein